MFTRNSAKRLVHRWQTTCGGAWSNWVDLGGTLYSDPAVVVNPNGAMSVFAEGPNGDLVHTWQVAAGGGWAGWVTMPGEKINGRPAVVIGATGGMALFALGNVNRGVVHTWQSEAGGPWAPWVGLGGSPTSEPSAVRNPNGAISLFARDADGLMTHNWQSSGGGAWNRFVSWPNDLLLPEVDLGLMESK
jgi:hypothetical protein